MPDSKIKIFVFYYKNGPVLKLSPVYQPIMAGKSILREKAEFQGDDTGENISHKNKYYSELTGIYWVWKNTRQNISGACHYRRYFTAQPEPFLYRLKRSLYFPAGLYKKRFGLIYTNNTKLFLPRIISEKEIELLIQKYEIGRASCRERV